ncbi:MAG: carbohydrate binding domain-containing protein [Elusimicrobiota bacterium]
MKKLVAMICLVAMCVSPVMARTYVTLDNMDATTGWSGIGENDAVNTLTSVAGQTGNAVQSAYTMNTGSWINIGKTPETSNLSTMESLRLLIRGTGTENSIQVKLRDDGDRIFGYDIATPKSNAADWTTLEIEKAQFIYFWGGADQNFNWGNVVSIDIALSGATGSGTLLIDELELGNPDSSGGNTADVTVTVVNAEVSVEVTGSVALGTVVAGQSKVSESAVTVTNSGTGNATFKLQLTNPADWTASTVADTNQYVLNGAFASAAAAITWSEANHNLTTTSVSCTDTIFSGDQTGTGVAASASRSLWFQFKAPTVVSSEAAHTITVTVTAVAQP